ncbi:hypothetical protein AB0A95_30575 [Micromonospora sp. NPDC049230]|uniref:hypothetical protein n=1 Tax=Micromonospora sp. NPDC049230 TaxID=3155502 RepID=UPI0033C6AEEC
MLAIKSVADLRTGDIGFSSIRGRVGAGVLAGQTSIDLAALLRGRRVENAGWITHAFIVSQSDYESAAIVEAMPSGARRVVLTGRDRIGPGYAYVRLPDEIGLIGWRTAAGITAAKMVGTPYGFAQYAALAALTLTGGNAANAQGPLARYVNRRDPVTRHPVQMICSQLVDEVLRAVRVPLFKDGRPPQYVTPGALFWRAAQIGDVCIC